MSRPRHPSNAGVMVAIESAIEAAIADREVPSEAWLTTDLWEAFCRSVPRLDYKDPNTRWWNGVAFFHGDDSRVVCKRRSYRVRSFPIPDVHTCTKCGWWTPVDDPPLVEACPECTSTCLGLASRRFAMLSHHEAEVARALDTVKALLSWEGT